MNLFVLVEKFSIRRIVLMLAGPGMQNTCGLLTWDNSGGQFPTRHFIILLVYMSTGQCFLDSAFLNLTWLWLWLQVKVRGLTLTLTCAESGQVRSESESGQFNRLNWLLNWLLFFSLKINNLIKFFKFLCVLNCKYVY